MALDLTEKAKLLSSKTNIEQQFILEVEGFPIIFGAQEVQRLVKYGDDGIEYGDVGLRYGAPIKDDRSKDYISLNRTTNQIRQQIESDKASIQSIQRFRVSIVDKNQEITKAFSPDFYLEDPLYADARVYLNFIGGAHPEDSVLLIAGVIDEITFTAGTCEVYVSSSLTKLRSELFPVVTTELTGPINAGQTIIPLATVENIIEEQDILTSFIRIDDEIIQIGGISGSSLTGCTRGALGTIADTHDDEAEVNTLYRLQAPPIEMALKLMISQSDEIYATLEASNFVQITPTLIQSNGILVNDTVAKETYGITVGDTISCAGSASNNFTDRTIVAIIKIPQGQIFVVDGADLVPETDAGATLSIASKYNTLPTGAKMSPREVDVQKHEDILLLFSTAFPNYDFLLDEEIVLKDWLAEQVLYPSGLYSLIRKGRVSANITIPPILDGDSKILDESNIIFPEKIQIKRTTNSFFYNSIVYKFNPDPLDPANYRSGLIQYSARSQNRIAAPNNPMTIEADGLRDDSVTLNYIRTQSKRTLDRFQFAAEHFEEIVVNYKTGAFIDVGDTVIMGTSFLQISDINEQSRKWQPRIMEVINKTLNLKGGSSSKGSPVKLKLLDTKFALDGQYGTVAPSSRIGVGSTVTKLILKNSFSSGPFDVERQKWENFIGYRVLVRNADYTFQEEVELKGFDSGNPDAILIEALSSAPPEDFVVEPPFYPDNSDREDQFLWKQAHVYTNPQVEVVSGINSTSFTVSGADISKFLLGAFLRVHNFDFSVDSAPTADLDDLEISSIVGNTITVDRSMGFTPSAGYIVDLIGFKDGGAPYRYI